MHDELTKVDIRKMQEEIDYRKSEVTPKLKEQLKAAILMDMENPSSRMSSLGKDMLIYDEIKPIEEIVREIDSVEKCDVENAAHMIFEKEYARGVLLPVER